MHEKNRRLAVILSVVSVLLAGPALASEYAIDPVHSSVLFKVNHLGASNVYGMMPDISGTLSFDPENLGNCALSITVKPESLTTFNPRRDTHLKSVDFFNTKEFPVISFKSASWKKVADRTYELKGDFTLLGITKPITVQVLHVGVGKDQRGIELAGFEATFTIDRTDFAMNYGVAEKGGLGKDVTITVAVECHKQ